ncbi:MAG: rod-binding protein [Spirochaetaceae bacterium]|jgi:flagellar protein FlgJ|nr:rod-binding protein [Spirochaetaceae bacterium]
MEITGAAAYQLDNNRYSLDALTEINKTVNKTMGGREADFSEYMAGAVSEQARPKVYIDKNDKLYEQCEALETFLLKTLINGMRKTVEKSELSKTGFAGEMYEDMLYDEYAKDFTRNAGFGLAELAYLELTRQRQPTPANASQRQPTPASAGQPVYRRSALAS